MINLTEGYPWKPTFAEIAFEWQAGKALAFTTGPGALPQREESCMLAIRTQPIEGEALLLRSGVAQGAKGF